MSNTFWGVLSIGLLLYFLPALNAYSKRHQSSAAILAVNVLFGWTFLGWGIAFIWSLTGVWPRGAAPLSANTNPGVATYFAKRQTNRQNLAALCTEFRARNGPLPVEAHGLGLYWQGLSARLSVSAADLRVVLTRQGHEVYSRTHTTTLEAVDTIIELRERFAADLAPIQAPALEAGLFVSPESTERSLSSSHRGANRVFVVFLFLLVGFGTAVLVIKQAHLPITLNSIFQAATKALPQSFNSAIEKPADLLVTDSTELPLRREPALAPAASKSLGPSFDCEKASQPLAQLICSSPALSRIDLEFNQAYYALRYQLSPADQRLLAEEDLQFLASVQRSCGVPGQGPAIGSPDCIAVQYQRQRSIWRSRVTGLARDEIDRPIEQHIALQAEIQRLGFLSSGSKINGVYNSATRAAIMEWQRSMGRSITGFISNEDIRALRAGWVGGRPSETAVPGREPTTSFTPKQSDAVYPDYQDYLAALEKIQLPSDEKELSNIFKKYQKLRDDAPNPFNATALTSNTRNNFAPVYLRAMYPVGSAGSIQFTVIRPTSL